MVTYHLDAAKVDDSIDVNNLSTLDNHPSLIQKNLLDFFQAADWELPYDSESLEITGSPEMKSKYKFKNTLPGSAAPSGIRMYHEILLGKDSDLPIVYVYDKVRFNVTYTDGVDNEELFADQNHVDVDKDIVTPAFIGTPSREGFTFNGWLPEVADTVTEDVIYVAQWAKIPTVFTITYTDGTGTESIFGDQIVKDIPKDSPTPAYSGSTIREGYTFKGWTPKVDATVTQDAVYTADWEKNKYTVTYESNGGTSTTSETVDYNTVFIKPENPTKEGNIFKGWFSDQTLT